MTVWVELARYTNQLFTDADTTAKNKLLRFMPADFTLYGKALSCRLNNTYETLASLNRKGPNGPNNTNWCSRWVKVYTLSLMR